MMIPISLIRHRGYTMTRRRNKTRDDLFSPEALEKAWQGARQLMIDRGDDPDEMMKKATENLRAFDALPEEEKARRQDVAVESAFKEFFEAPMGTYPDDLPPEGH